MKRIESACLVQTLIFDTPEEAEMYRKQLEKKRIPCRMDGMERLEDGTVGVQLRRRYVHYPVGEYLKEQ